MRRRKGKNYKLNERKKPNSRKKKEEALAALEEVMRVDLEQKSKPQSDDVQQGERESKSEWNDVEIKEAESEVQNKLDTKSEVPDNGEENAMDKKPDADEEKKRQAFPIPTDKMDGFSVMGEKFVDWEQEREPVKFDEMEILESAPDSEDDEAKMTSEFNDVEMKDESEPTVASESKDADEEEPATQCKGIGHFKQEKSRRRPRTSSCQRTKKPISRRTDCLAFLFVSW
jgi:hypothetical protein